VFHERRPLYTFYIIKYVILYKRENAVANLDQVYYPRNPTSIILLPQNPIRVTGILPSILECLPQRSKLDANVS
jgi:hypothetical protein